MNEFADGKFRRIEVSQELLLDVMRGHIPLCRGGMLWTITDLPKDTVIVGAQWNWQFMMLELMCHSSEWEPVSMGCEIPFARVTVHSHLLPVKIAVRKLDLNTVPPETLDLLTEFTDLVERD